MKFSEIINDNVLIIQLIIYSFCFNLLIYLYKVMQFFGNKNQMSYKFNIKKKYAYIFDIFKNLF